jgi:DNA-binding CsgD family transcriptional regulator
MKSRRSHPGESSTADGLEDLERGRAFFVRRAWGDAYRWLSHADEFTPLRAGDLEMLARSAYLIGRDAEFERLLDRAHRQYLNDGRRTAAARCGFWLGLGLLLRGEAALASGWLAGTQRLIEGVDCVEQGYLLLPTSEEQLRKGDAVQAAISSGCAAEIGERFSDPDLVACARHQQGRALILQGSMQAGFALLDEAMIAVVGDRVSPIMAGLIYCSAIEACQQVYAWGRAREWTTALARWCEQQPDLLAFTGTCLVHRAELLQLRGAWPDAMAEACRACERFSQAQGGLSAQALYRQAEIHRLRGELTAAEEAYARAGHLGFELQPGLALLRLAQGNTDAACAGLRRAISETSDGLQRARLLPALVEVKLSKGDLPAARDASMELSELAQRFRTDVLSAMAAHVSGAVRLAEGDAPGALGSLRRALDGWRRVGAPYESARVRLLIGQACRALQDDEGARVEFIAAKAEFERLGAAPDVARWHTLLESQASLSKHLLSRRELQVLRLIAAGKTNKAIGAELLLSERTIDRHVSNLLNKLDAPSRAAAIACAFDRNLL